MGLFDAAAREYTYISAITRTLIGMRDVKPESAHTIVDVVEAQARTTPDAVAFYYLDSTMSYAALNAAADRIAHWARTNGIQRGEAVALLMENRPDYIVAWLGLLNAGAVAALIKTNLRGTALAHSIAISGAHHVIVGQELADI
jgi:fatty-acyl-CoA synthase